MALPKISSIYSQSKHKTYRFSSNDFSNKRLHNIRDHLLSCDNFASETLIDSKAIPNQLLIKETEDMDYIIKPQATEKNGSLCITELYSKKMRKKIITELRKKEKFTTGSGTSGIVINKINTKNRQHGATRNNQNFRLNYSTNVQQKSQARMKLYLDKLMGIKCYKNSVIAFKEPPYKNSQIIHKYLRGVQLLNRAKQKSLLISKSYKKLNPDNILSLRKQMLGNTPSSSFSIVLRKSISKVIKPHKLDKIAGFINDCGEYLNRSKVNVTSPMRFDDFLESSYSPNKIEKFGIRIPTKASD
jgi:hypothetical protein